ncbi:glucose 1-dehydrogenase, partial [Chloroflexota bacterium]
ARAGADVVVASRKLGELEKVAEEIREMGRESLAIEAHVGRLEQIENLVTKTLEKFKRIDILVNNAGTNPTLATALDIEERAWDAIMNLNLKGLFFLSQAVARVMKEQGGGCIINVASVDSFSPGTVPVYSISKAGVIMATKVMALEYAKYGIRVNAIAPGLVKTAFSQALMDDTEIFGKMMGKVPMGRPAEPEEMVGTMLYLASDAASYVTGTAAVVDGGQLI